MAPRKFIHINDNGASKPESLDALMRVAENRVQAGEGRFVITVDGQQVGQEHKRSDALSIFRRRLDLGLVGPVYRVRGPDGVEFAAREIREAREVIDTSGNDKVDKTWSAIVQEFGKDNVFSLGFLVCKPDSQHRFGNAGDGGHHHNPKIYDVADFLVEHRKLYSIRNVIVGTRINHLGVWAPYTGIAHVAHFHWDHDPMFDTNLPCGLRG